MNDSEFENLQRQFNGELQFDSLTRKIYSTDASLYQELPRAVALPKNDSDIAKLIQFATARNTSLIPRTAGTSLAGQVVGSGIIVDVSRHFDRIVEINTTEKWVRVQPGVIRDELNDALRPHGLMFGPETSTSNRAMIGGMLGNNSCGSNSIVYGTTRDQTIEVTGFLSDGSLVTFGPVDNEQFEAKKSGQSLEQKIYQRVHELLSPSAVQAEIKRQFPKPEIHRRNTGYAVDRLIQSSVFGSVAEPLEPFNFCHLIAGSEGTLFFATEIKLQLHTLPPPRVGLLCVHCSSVSEALRANVLVMQHEVYASELIDRMILEGAARNSQQRKNADFVEGDPAAILIVELRGDSESAVSEMAAKLQHDLQAAEMGHAFPLVTGPDTQKVWSLRKAGLGIVANVVGDAKPATCIEDTAVSIEDLPNYIAEVDQLLRDKYDRECVYYAHAGSGEIHLRPVLNLKTAAGHAEFRSIAEDIAQCVKKYKGSLSGEHGDGRLRGEFIREMIGDANYQLLKEIKHAFDPNNIFNPGKIVDAPPMDQGLRYRPGQSTAELETVFDFSTVQGLQRAAEMCNGVGACRKTEKSGATMCPSYMATRNEQDTTRARANILRHVLTENPDKIDPLNDEEVHSVMDLCLSCKACKTECPSNVDVAKMKAEVLQAYYDTNGVPRRVKRIADVRRLNRLAAKAPRLANMISSAPLASRWLKSFLGFAPQRPLPRFARQSLRAWFASHVPHENAGQKGALFFFADEFTDCIEPSIGIAAIELLERLGWQVRLPQHAESGRAFVSKGLLRRAQFIAQSNVRLLAPLVNSSQPLVGIEPSALLMFRDEYIDLLRGEEKAAAKKLATNCLTFEEFIDQQIQSGQISSASFHDQEKVIRLHGHCHQKALVGLVPSVRALQLPVNYRVRLIPSGCCGMAGSFGYEEEHYEVSMQIGELVLFPTVRDEPTENIICATGVSCRHQIADGTGRESLHPAEILRNALRG